MKNGDPVLHNVRSFSVRNRAFNVAQPAGSEDRKKVFKYREKAVMIQCDIHPWMKAYIAVVPHPYFAVTGDDGTFALNDLPPGDYTIEVWHEKYGTQEQQITVDPDSSQEIEFSYTG